MFGQVMVRPSTGVGELFFRRDAENFFHLGQRRFDEFIPGDTAHHAVAGIAPGKGWVRGADGYRKKQSDYRSGAHDLFPHHALA
jgi:hypothetical protein